MECMYTSVHASHDLLFAGQVLLPPYKIYYWCHVNFSIWIINIMMKNTLKSHLLYLLLVLAWFIWVNYIFSIYWIFCFLEIYILVVGVEDAHVQNFKSYNFLKKIIEIKLQTLTLYLFCNIYCFISFKC